MALTPEEKAQYSIRTNALLNHVRTKFSIKSDKSLAATLGVKHPVICCMRSSRIAMGPAMVLRMYDCGVNFDDMRKILGKELWKVVVWGRLPIRQVPIPYEGIPT